MAQSRPGRPIGATTTPNLTLDVAWPMAPKRGDLLERLRQICLSLPEVTERLSHGTPTFFVRDKSAFVNVWLDGHHSNAFPHLWCAAWPGVQEALVKTDPERFFRPPYVGHRGWIGVRLDVDLEWDEIARFCQDAYRAVAPKKLIAHLEKQHGEA